MSVEEGYKQLQKVLKSIHLSHLLIHTHSQTYTSDCTRLMFSASLVCLTCEVWYLRIAGRENPKERRNGDVCNSACYNVLHHASSLGPKADILMNLLFTASDECYDCIGCGKKLRDRNCIETKKKI